MIYIILVVAAFAGFFLWFQYVKKPAKKKAAIERLMSNIGYDIPFNWTQSDITAQGCGVVWNGDQFGSEAAKQLAFKCIDVGYRNAFNAMRGKFPNWDFNPALSVYAFMDGNYDSQDVAGAKIFKLKNGTTAGAFTVGTGDGYPMLLMILPNMKSNDWFHTVFLATLAWFEDEHNAEYRSDSTEFLKGSGRVPEFPDSHPHHLPEGFVPEPAPEPLPHPTGLLAHPLKGMVAVRALSYEEAFAAVNKAGCVLNTPKFAPRALTGKPITAPDYGLTVHDVVPKQIADRYAAAKKNTIAGK